MDDQLSDAQARNYKFKELRVYSSTEWLADNKKKYRQVFDVSETAYIYAELSFYNKLFDRDDWEVDFELRCFESKNLKKKICDLNFRKKISRFDNIVFIREGWGNKREGTFWKKGAYFWEAWLDGVLIGTKYFYVEDFNKIRSQESTPPLKLKSLRLYEGQYDDVLEEERNYMVAFSAADTRYIYTEINLVNKHKLESWHCELFVKFYNQARELKGQVIRLHNIKKGENLIKMTAGWGANSRGSWKEGIYTAEVVFMDKLLAAVDFEVSSDYVSGISVLKIPDYSWIEESTDDGSLDITPVYESLDHLIGLNEIKKQVHAHSKYLEFLKLRKEKGFKETDQINLHLVFTGNPGTGKTTVAKMMGRIYRGMGLLSKGHVVEVDRVDLVGEYIGQTAPKTKNVIEKARGGILFIDEAYALARANDDSKDFGKEAIEILIKELSENRGDLAVIVAGYPQEMEYFLKSNPGLKSRFKNYFEFSDYTPQELIEIALSKAKEKEMILNNKSISLLSEIIIDEYRDRDRSFGNARFVNDLLDKIKVNLALRIMARKNPDQLSKSQLSRVQVSDILPLKDKLNTRLPSIPIDEAMLEEAIFDLNQLIGIDNVKAQIFELINIILYHSASGKSILSKYSLHTVLIGNPGTGKTTIARILARIYRALGLLERGHIVETDRQGLVAGFVGQTAIKTKEMIDKALDGVLFIDEAYALSNFNGLQGDYGNEAIQTLLKCMEDYRGRFYVIVAGYPDNMEHFLKANPGFSSRFDKTYKFEDYTSIQLLQIAKLMFKEEGYKLAKNAEQHLSGYLTELHLKRDKYFGNARTVRLLVQDIIRKQNLRLSATLEAEDIVRMKNSIVLNDVVEALQEYANGIVQRAGIGFK